MRETQKHILILGVAKLVAPTPEGRKQQAGVPPLELRLSCLCFQKEVCHKMFVVLAFRSTQQRVTPAKDVGQMADLHQDQATANKF